MPTIKLYPPPGDPTDVADRSRHTQLEQWARLLVATIGRANKLAPLCVLVQKGAGPSRRLVAEWRQP